MPAGKQKTSRGPLGPRLVAALFDVIDEIHYDIFNRKANVVWDSTRAWFRRQPGGEAYWDLMAKHTLPEDDPLFHDCDHCSARYGQRCHTKAGIPMRGFHAGRKAKARGGTDADTAQMAGDRAARPDWRRLRDRLLRRRRGDRPVDVVNLPE